MFLVFFRELGGVKVVFVENFYMYVVCGWDVDIWDLMFKLGMVKLKRREIF